MEDNVMNVIEEVVNNEENLVENVVVQGNGLKGGFIGAGIVIVAYAAYKGGKKIYAKIKAKKAEKEAEQLIVETTAEDVAE